MISTMRIITWLGILAMLVATLTGGTAAGLPAEAGSRPVPPSQWEVTEQLSPADQALKEQVGPPAEVTSLQFLSGDAANGLAAYEQFQPEIAQGGSQYLAVWTDARTDGGRRVGNSYGGLGSEIYAARLDASGNLIDTTPFIVAERVGAQDNPQVVWNGQNWLVGWESQEPNTYYFTAQLLAARVSPQGVVLDTQPLVISSLPFSGSIEYTIGSDGGAAGGNWAAFWQGSSGGENDLRGARISAEGVILDPGGIVVAPAEYYLRAHFDVAFAQDEYLLTWQAINVLQGKRLQPDLTAIDAGYFNISPNNWTSLNRSRVATNGTDFFAVWEAWVSTTYYDGILAARINHAGQVLDPSGIIVWQAYGGFTGRWPNAVWDGTNWFVSFMLNGITVLRVSPGGSVIDPNNIPPDFDNASNKWNPDSATRTGGGIRLAWMDTRAGSYYDSDIYSAAVGPDRAMGPETAVSNGLPSQDRSSVAANGSGYLVAFRSQVSGSMRILAQMVDTTGGSLWPEPVQVFSGATVSSPDVAYSGSVYLVVWGQSGTIYSRRLGADGSLLDPAPVAVMPGKTPAVAALGGNFLVVAVHAPSNPQFQFPFSARVSGASGAVLDPPTQIGQYFATNPDVTAVGNRWIAAWERHWSHDDPHNDLNAAFVEANGAPNPEFNVFSAPPSFYLYAPALAGNGTQALLVWQDPRVSNADWNLYAKRILADGTRLDGSGIPVSTAPNNQQQAAAAWDGARFVVAFEDLRANTLFFDTRTDIYSNRIAADGSVLDGNGVAAMAAFVPEIYPDVAGANGGALISGSIYRDVPPYMAYRAGVFPVGSSGPSPTATSTPVATATATPTATATAGPPPTATPTYTPAPTPTSTPASPGCSSRCLRSTNISLLARGSNNISVIGRVTVRNENGALMAGALVSITWTLPGGGVVSQGELTDSKGVAQFRVTGGSGTYTLTVTGISLSGFTFDPAHSVLVKSVSR